MPPLFLFGEVKMSENRISLSGIFSEGYGIVPKKLFKSKDIGKYEKLILCYMLSYTGRGNDCFPSVQTMKDDLGLGNSTVCNAINKCVQMGYIEKVKLFPKNPMNHANKYILCFMGTTTSQGENSDIPTSGITTSQRRNQDVPPWEQNNNNINNNSINNNKKKVSVSDNQLDQGHRPPGGGSPSRKKKRKDPNVEYVDVLYEIRMSNGWSPTADETKHFYVNELRVIKKLVDQFSDDYVNDVLGYAKDHPWWRNNLKSFRSFESIRGQYLDHEEKKNARRR